MSVHTCPQYGRIQLPLPPGCRAAFVHTPDGQIAQPLPFLYQPTEFAYDRHGYERQTPVGQPTWCVRFTPVTPGTYRLADGAGQTIGAFDCTASDHPGYVRVSGKDPRYFATSRGQAYVPIGLNLVGCDYDRQPAGSAHFAASNRLETTGLIQWKRWFAALAAAKANYARIWLSNPYFNARTEIMGVHDLAAFNRLDAVMELARAAGVRVKLCLEHFRTFTDSTHFAYKRVIDPDTGRQLTDVETWFNHPSWNARWLQDVEPYLARYQNDPAVMAWELWNEIDCGDACFASVAAFTKRMLPRVRSLSPNNLVVNSLGSFDEAGKQQAQDAFRSMPEMDFIQVHRYLDQGAPLSICHTDPVAFSLDAVARNQTGEKPVLLTETGAVNDRHVGPFRFYPADHDGLIFHDVTYPAFFAGAAGSGHIWHWNQYVEPNNLWRHFLPLANALEGVQADGEGFESLDLSTKHAWALALRGKRHILALVRNRADRWDHVLRDGRRPPTVEGLRLPLTGQRVETFWLMDEPLPPAAFQGDQLTLPAFVHGCVLRVTR